MTAAAPDYVEPVHGWRSWIVDRAPAGASLRSVVHPADWPPGRPLAAACPDRGPGFPSRAFPHDAPYPGCRCGVHAHRRPEEAANYIEVPSRRHLCSAIGLVALWGSVIEGSEGWRASRAYPARLYLPLRRHGRAVLRGLMETARGLGRYGVPVEIVDCRRGGLLEALGVAPAEAPPRPPTTTVEWTPLGLRRR